MADRGRNNKAPFKGPKTHKKSSFHDRNTSNMQHSRQFKVQDDDDTERNLILKCKPLNLYEWQDAFIQYAIKTYGIAGECLRDKGYPVYINQDAFTLPENETAPEQNTVEYNIYKTTMELRIKKWFKDKHDLNANCSRLFSDIILHMCEESRVITRQRTNDYEELQSNSDIVGLFTAIETAHLNNGGPEATLTNKIEARRYLERLGQRPNQPLHLFEKEFNRRLQLCKGVGLEIPEKEVILMYLSSLDQTIYKNKMQYFFEFENNDQVFPETLQAAKEEMRKVLATHSALRRRMQTIENKRYTNTNRYNSDVDDDKERFANTALSNNSHKNSKDQNKYAHIKCKFCNQNGHSAQVCTMIDEYKQSANTATKSDTPTSTSANSNESKEQSTTSNKKKSSNATKSKALFACNSNNFSYPVIGTLIHDDCQHENPVLETQSYISKYKYPEILDNGSNTNIFVDVSDLKHIEQADPTSINGVNGDVPLLLDFGGIHSDWGETYVNPTGNINIVSFSKQRKEYYVKYNDEENSFTLKHKTTNKSVIFRENRYGLYERVREEPVAAVSIQKFNAVQRRRAEAARKLHDCLSHPSDRVLGYLLDNNGIVNCNLTSKDLRVAMILFGPCEICRIGKATLPKRFGLSRDIGEYPGHIVHMDIMFVPTVTKMLMFLIAVCDCTGFILSYLLKSKSKQNILSTIKRFVNFFDYHGWSVKRIITDPEGVFIGLHDDISEQLKIDMYSTPVNAHERVVERFIRTIRERVRINVHSQDYRVPSKLIAYSVNKPISDLNDTPNTKTINVTPRQVVCGVKLDYKVDMCPPWGTIVDVKIPRHDHPTEARVQPAVVVGKSSNSRGGIKAICIVDGKLSRAKDRHRYWIKNDVYDTIKALNKISDEEEKNAKKRGVGGNKMLLTFQDYMSESNYNNYDEDYPHNDSDDDYSEDNQTVNVDCDDDENYKYQDHNDSSSDIIPVEECIDSDQDDSDYEYSSVSDDDDNNSAIIDDNNELQNELRDIRDIDESDNDESKTNGPALRPNRSSWKTRDFSYLSSTDQKQMESIQQQWKHFSFNITARKMVSSYGDVGKESVAKELLQLFEEKKVFIPIITLPEGAKAITGHLFGKEKFTATGAFDKLKSRFVGGGHLIDRSIYDYRETSSPTAAFETVLTALALSADRRTHHHLTQLRRKYKKVGAFDIPCAYLNSDLIKRHFMRIDKFLVSIMMEVLPPYYQAFVQPDGSMLVEIVKALYGLPESSVQWYFNIKDFLLEIGFTCSDYDKCLFYRKNDDDESPMDTIVVYVDDILYSVSSVECESILLQQFRDKYGDIKVQNSNTISYLGINIEIIDNVGIKLSMPNYIDALLEKYNITKTVTTPADKDFMTDLPNDEPCDRSTYLSMLMSIYYLANRCRGDLLFAMSVLATKAKDPKKGDMNKLTRVLKYLKFTRDYKITLGAPSNEEPNYDVNAFVDASHNLHPIDCKGHTGLVIILGNIGPICVKSWKHKSIGTSTSHSELISVYDSLQHILIMKGIRSELLGHQQTAMIAQDNNSTIFVAQNEFIKSTKMKYIKIRFYYIQELVNDQEIELYKVPTEAMKADGLTKVLCGSQFRVFVVYLKLG